MKKATKKRKESNETRYRKALEFIVANSLHQNTWYVDTALNALGKEHRYYKEIKG